MSIQQILITALTLAVAASLLITLIRVRRRHQDAPASSTLTAGVLHDQCRPASWNVEMLHAFSRLR